jgi:anti-sigma B factor antagonist
MPVGPNETSILQERDVDGVMILTIRKGLKGEVEAILKERLNVLVRMGHFRILIDMKHLPYLDSTEIGRLIRCHLSVRQAGGRVRLCNVSDRLRALLKITRMDTVIDSFPTEEMALESFQNP